MNKSKILLLTSACCYVASVSWADIPADWKFSQEIQVASPGLTKVRLPIETLGAALPSLADLRLLDSTGREIPFLIDHPTPEPARDWPLERMVMTMEKKKTVITGAVPAGMLPTGFEAITLFTPTEDFLKPVSLEVSPDGKHWKMLIHQGPIFKQSGDRMSSTIRFPKGSWAFLRITLDDSETPPLRVSQVRLFAPGHAIQDLQKFEPHILEIASDAHRTEIRLQLPAQGLPIDSIHLEVPETTFRRQIRVAGREFLAGEFRESQISQGSIYRITLGNQKTEELSIPVGRLVLGPQITVTIENGDSPPLTVDHLLFKMIPRDLVFDAPSAGIYSLCSGNPKAPPREYDVAALRGTLSKVTLPAASLKPSQVNPAYQPPPPAVSGDEEGSDIETDPWHFRKKIEMVPSAISSNLWRIELDPPAIAHNGGRLEALRVVRREKQIPYIVDYSGVERHFAPTINAEAATVKTKSRWVIALPESNLPVSRLVFTVPNTLFQRTLTLYEVSEAEPATVEQETPEGKPMRVLAIATWTRTRADGPSNYELVMAQPPQTNHLILETDNGDNAPIQLMDPQAYYRAPRLLFRAQANDVPVYLYYGQPEVAGPQYDLNLIASELLSTPPQEAQLGKEEALKATPWWEPPAATGNMKYLFWGVMIFVVLGLLVVIAKLLPAVEGTSHG